MTDPSMSTVHIAGVFARAAATGLAGAALSAERHPVAIRRVGLVFAAGLGTAAGLAARPTERAAAPGSLPPVAAAALGVATFALTAGVSEVGLRTQRRFERWADAAWGRPRLAVGLATGAIAVVLDLADDWTGPDGAIRSSH